MNRFQIAVVSSSNMNRSMEVQEILMRRGIKVESYGIGDMVRLPGTAADLPNCYEFGVPYNDIYNDLVAKDKSFYTQNGVLNMLDRNRRIKPCPEKFQTSDYIFDVIVTCEERVYEQVFEFLCSRSFILKKVVHIVNFEIQDDIVDATIGAYSISDMITKLAQSRNLDSDIENWIFRFELESLRSVTNCIMFY